MAKSLSSLIGGVVTYVLTKRKCKSWFCNECKKSKALSLREVLRSKISLFTVPKLLTFTVDPSRFSSAEIAYRVVRDGHFIPRMLRYLGVKNWFCVLEFQQNGFPHWHLLVDLSNQPTVYVRKSGGVLDVQKSPCPGHYEVKNFLDLARVHRLWRGWGIGEQVDLQTKKVRVSPSYAINYIIKYLLKNPVYGYPEWVLESSNIRLVSASRSLGALINLSSGAGPDEEEGEEGEECEEEEGESEEESVDDLFIDDMDQKPVISTLHRVGMCGLQTKAMRVENGVITGVVTYDLPYSAVVKVFSDRLQDFIFRLKSGVTCKWKACTSDLLDDIGDFSRNVQVSDLVFQKYKRACSVLGVSVVEPAF